MRIEPPPPPAVPPPPGPDPRPEPMPDPLPTPDPVPPTPRPDPGPGAPVPQPGADLGSMSGLRPAGRKPAGQPIAVRSASATYSWSSCSRAAKNGSATVRAEMPSETGQSPTVKP
jgi:hypothetical protein